MMNSMLRYRLEEGLRNLKKGLRKAPRRFVKFFLGKPYRQYLFDPEVDVPFLNELLRRLWIITTSYDVYNEPNQTFVNNPLNKIVKLITQFPLGLIETVCIWHLMHLNRALFFKEEKKEEDIYGLGKIKKGLKIVFLSILAILTIPSYIIAKIVRVGIVRPIFSPKESYDDAIHFDRKEYDKDDEVSKKAKILAAFSIIMSIIGWTAIVGITMGLGAKAFGVVAVGHVSWNVPWLTTGANALISGVNSVLALLKVSQVTAGILTGIGGLTVLSVGIDGIRMTVVNKMKQKWNTWKQKRTQARIGLKRFKQPRFVLLSEIRKKIDDWIDQYVLRIDMNHIKNIEARQKTSCGLLVTEVLEEKNNPQLRDNRREGYNGVASSRSWTLPRNFQEDQEGRIAAGHKYHSLPSLWTTVLSSGDGPSLHLQEVTYWPDDDGRHIVSPTPSP